DHEIPDDGRPDLRFPERSPQGEPLFHPPLDWTERRRLVDEVYAPWYAEVRARREGLIRQYGRLAHLDLNTWGLGDLPEDLAGELDKHPKLMIANGGYPDTGEGERVSATPRATRALALALRQELGLSVGVNRRFKGGGVVRTFGHHAGNTLQLTWQRSLVTTPDELHLDPTRLRAFTRALSRALTAWLGSS
ncbi:MAG: N-formylglutamate amidohydrolase, partial [Alphaproteobacteria bacterium]|nr:N-formylglutamate amidohydrolase [Alphaproteobacteria bacterium]